MPPLTGEWLDALQGEFRKPYYRNLFQTVNEEYKNRMVFPPADEIFTEKHSPWAWPRL